MEQKFKIGDIVHLKSAEFPRMTVHAVGDESPDIFIELTWFDGNNFKYEKFNADTISLVDDNSKKDTDVKCDPSGYVKQESTYEIARTELERLFDWYKVQPTIVQLDLIDALLTKRNRCEQHKPTRPRPEPGEVITEGVRPRPQAGRIITDDSV